MKATHLRMKATKKSFNTKIPSNFLWLLILLPLVTSCDVLEDDPDVLASDTDIVKKEVHVFSNNTSVIDLNTIIQTNQPVRLEITSQTRKGDLTNLGKGLLQYVPANPSGKVRDAFEFAVFSESNQILKTDSVVIIVENDSTELPCGVFPIDDFVYNISRDSAVWINVLANDVICSSDSADIQLSIYKPADGFPPLVGHAEVVNNRIVYHPGDGFTGNDKIVYRVEGTDGAVAYGFVYIHQVQPCEFELHDDFFRISRDSSDSVGVLLPVFQNDVMCETFIAIDELHIFEAPHWGTATISSNGVFFVPSDSTLNSTKTDSIGYELCFDAVCYRAKVVLEIRKD